MLNHENEMDKHGLAVSPNPATGLVKVSFGSLDARDGSVEMVNALGAMVMHQQTGSAEMQLDFSALEKGVYLLIFRGKNAVASEKIIVN